MTATLASEHHVSLEWMPKIASYSAISIGLLVLCGLLLNSQFLANTLPGLAAMDPSTAVGLTMAGFSLRLLRVEGFNPWARRISKICRAAVGLVGLLTLFEYWLAATVSPLSAGMPPAAAMNFCILGAALIVFGVRRDSWMSQALSMAAVLFSLFAVAHHIYARTSNPAAAADSMSLQTALTFFMLAAGLLWATSNQGFLAILRADTEVGKMAGRLVPLAVVSPVILGYLSLVAERQILFNASLAKAIEAVFGIIVLGVFIWCPATVLVRVGTARKMVETTLQESEQRYKDLFEDIRDMVFTIDLKGRFTAVNRSAERILNRSREALLEDNVFQVLTPESAAKFHDALRKGLLGERVGPLELVVKVKNGETRTLTMQSSVLSQGCSPIGLQCVAYETESSRHNAQLLQAYARAV